MTDSSLTPDQQAHDDAVPADPTPLPPESPETADPADGPVSGPSAETLGSAVDSSGVGSSEQNPLTSSGPNPVPDASSAVPVSPDFDPLDGEQPEPGVAVFAGATEATSEDVSDGAVFAAGTSADTQVADVPTDGAENPAETVPPVSVSDSPSSPPALSVSPVESSLGDGRISNEDLHALLLDVKRDIADAKAAIGDVFETVGPLVEQVKTDGLGGLLKALMGR